MPSSDDIKHQYSLLEIHRRNLNVYLLQHATFGDAYVPPVVMNGIREARDNIAGIKAVLRSWNEPVEDLPNDVEPEREVTSGASISPAPQPSPMTINIHGGTFSGPIAQTGGSSVSNVYNIAGDLQLNASSGKDDLLTALRQFKAEVDKAKDLPAIQAEEIREDVDSAMKAIDKPQPNPSRAVERLTSIQKVLDGMKDNIGSALALGQLIGQVLSALQGIHL